ncbi:MAG: FGGY family carbohydrate kinase [Verrucomicrobiota bacterium]|nr:FGGY family carbohydrate kinase [Verrucomicrobiota bacterium]
MAVRRFSSAVLAMDIGTSSLRTALFDGTARRIADTTATRKYQVNYTSDGGAELDSGVVLRAAKSCVRSTLRAGAKARIAAVSGCGFWHSLLGLNAARQPITPIWTWADTRANSDAERLRERFDERAIQQRTGCMLRAPYWPAKLSWIRRTNPRLFGRVRRWVSAAEWLYLELFGVELCSFSMASGTGLYNLRRADWDAGLLEWCGLSREQLNPIGDRPGRARRVAGALCEAEVFAAIGDGAAGNLGSGADRRGVIAVNIGTSAAVRMTESRTAKGRLPFGLFRHAVDGTRAVMGGAISNAGNLHQWCARELRAAPDGPLARSAAAENDLVLVPFWVGERAPSWPPDLGGAMIGLRQSTAAAQIESAATSSVFYRLAEILALIEAATAPAKEIVISGGIVHAPDALRILADAFGRDVRVCREPEASIRGAAIHAVSQRGQKPPALKRGRLIRHDARLAAKHRLRRERQSAAEAQMTKFIPLLPRQ